MNLIIGGAYQGTGMDVPLVHQLSRQWHSWAAKYGADKR